MSSSPSILLIVPFFGSWPKWTPAFLESCRLNADIEWLFFGDRPFHWQPPPNVRFQQMGLSELLARTKATTGFDVQKENYAGRCDLRPAYGMIFADYIRGYDFWGHCDVDILWGRLRRFFTDSILEEYSIVSTMMKRISGPLALYRNIPEVNNFFLEVPDCRLWLESPVYCSFDEALITKHIRRLLAEDRLPFRVFWENTLVVDLWELRQRPHGWMWKEGRILDAQEMEYMYLHFGMWRHTFRSIKFGPSENPLYVTQFGIFHKPLPYLDYWRRRLAEVRRLHYWRGRLAEACRKGFRKVCSI
jgi:hypothetical protein